jgi:hypothetical protein
MRGAVGLADRDPVLSRRTCLQFSTKENPASLDRRSTPVTAWIRIIRLDQIGPRPVESAVLVLSDVANTHFGVCTVPASPRFTQSR